MHRKHIPAALGLAALALTAACGGGDDQAGSGDQPSGGAPEAPAATPPAGGTPAVAANLPPGVTPQMVSEGKQIFTGQGICQTCHGPDAKGTAMAPNLTDGTWINIDGSYDAIVNLVNTGVPQPKEHPALMPPKGGSAINDQQVRAVAAYVYSLSHS
ncbi:MAG: cytochrome c [Longimicrobiaceae bacterium]